MCTLILNGLLCTVGGKESFLSFISKGITDSVPNSNAKVREAVFLLANRLNPYSAAVSNNSVVSSPLVLLLQLFCGRWMWVISAGFGLAAEILLLNCAKLRTSSTESLISLYFLVLPINLILQAKNSFYFLAEFLIAALFYVATLNSHRMASQLHSFCAVVSASLLIFVDPSFCALLAAIIFSCYYRSKAAFSVFLVALTALFLYAGCIAVGYTPLIKNFSNWLLAYDATPNCGFWWYLQMECPMRFLSLLNYLLLVATPILTVSMLCSRPCMRLDSALLLFLSFACCVIFSTYPSLLYYLLLFKLMAIFHDSRCVNFKFLIAPTAMVVSLLLVVGFHKSWIEDGRCNSNAVYFPLVVFTLSLVSYVVEFVRFKQSSALPES